VRASRSAGLFVGFYLCWTLGRVLRGEKKRLTGVWLRRSRRPTKGGEEEVGREEWGK